MGTAVAYEGESWCAPKQQHLSQWLKFRMGPLSAISRAACGGTKTMRLIGDSTSGLFSVGANDQTTFPKSNYFRTGGAVTETVDRAINAIFFVNGRASLGSGAATILRRSLRTVLVSNTAREGTTLDSSGFRKKRGQVRCVTIKTTPPPRLDWHAVGGGRRYDILSTTKCASV